jgi:pimeloyl-ACP methyl ester carboxylesterase
VSAVTTVGLVLALAVALVPAGVHLGFRAPRIRETGTPGDHGLAFEEVRIPTVRHRTLFGWLLPVPGATRTVVVLHGWGSNAEQMLPIAAPLWRAGLNVLLCDARSHGNSDSDVLTALVARYVEWVIGYRFEAIAPLNTLCQIACPVLLVHGKEDQTVPIGDARRIVAHCRAPQVQLLEIADAGHDSTDQIERYTGALLRFLDESWSAGAQLGPGAQG